MEFLVTLIPLIFMFVIFYFILILPEKKRKKKYEGMLNELKVNDRVITRGGIIGRIVKINEENIVIETSSDRTKIELTRQGISTKIEN